MRWYLFKSGAHFISRRYTDTGAVQVRLNEGLEDALISCSLEYMLGFREKYGNNTWTLYEFDASAIKESRS